MTATVLVPTWDAPDTLGPAVRSALRQTASDLEVLIVGDGVTPRSRPIVESLLREDSRVRFLDLPKESNRGERNRDVGVREAVGEAIVYLADDDLLLPRHVQNLLTLLEDVPFAQSRNGFIDGDDCLRLFPTDLGDARWIEWHLLHPARNRVSVTGTAHTRASYLRLARGWDVPPPDIWADLYCWQEFFRQPWFRGATHPEMTTLQFPAPLRTGAPQEAERFARWEEFTRAPDAHERLQEMADAAAAKALIELSAASDDLHFVIADLNGQIESLNQHIARLDQRIAEQHAELRDVHAKRASARRRARRAEAKLAAMPSQRLRRAVRRLRSRLRFDREA